VAEAYLKLANAAEAEQEVPNLFVQTLLGAPKAVDPDRLCGKRARQGATKRSSATPAIDAISRRSATITSRSTPDFVAIDENLNEILSYGAPLFDITRARGYARDEHIRSTSFGAKFGAHSGEP
jgi:hypothetical protein